MINIITLFFIFIAIVFVFYKYPRKVFESSGQYAARLSAQVLTAAVVGLLWPITVFFILAYVIGTSLSRDK